MFRDNTILTFRCLEKLISRRNYTIAVLIAISFMIVHLPRATAVPDGSRAATGCVVITARSTEAPPGRAAPRDRIKPRSALLRGAACGLSRRARGRTELAG